MKNFLKINLSRNYKKISETQMMNWFSINKHKIFCSGDVNISEEGIEWVYDKGNAEIKINWNEISNVYVSSESGANNIYIESPDGRRINFYINNGENRRDKFLKYLKEFATLKGAQLIL